MQIRANVSKRWKYRFVKKQYYDYLYAECKFTYLSIMHFTRRKKKPYGFWGKNAVKRKNNNNRNRNGVVYLPLKSLYRVIFGYVSRKNITPRKH